ncbi:MULTISPECIES: cytochrome P450 [unclassified Nonomuraea]|uniref:cytochrome P450 n=1 Tax=unclassified Nonomuraea TaxID=2593643 RepID=UPI0033F48789
MHDRLFPFVTADPGEPVPEYAELRETEPVARVTLPTGHRGWLVTRHEDVRAVCGDPRFSKELATAPEAPRLLPIARGSRSIVNLDPPAHTRLRRLVAQGFSRRRTDALRPRVTEIAGDLVDAMTAWGTTADAVAALALPLPVTVICELLGVPVDDQERFRAWSDRLLSVPGPEVSAEETAEAGMNLAVYLAGLIEDKRVNPGDDVLTTLVSAYEEGDRLSEEELITFGMTLLVAGYHTTTSAIAHSLLQLLSRPERYAMLVARPELAERAVEELLRYSQIASGFGALRIATEDVELGGVRIPAGDPVIPLFTSANRDEKVFPDAGTLDLERADNPHLAFGAGMHYCLGAQLARVELRVLLEELVRRLPTLALDDQEDGIEWLTATAFPRPLSLHVSW